MKTLRELAKDGEQKLPAFVIQALAEKMDADLNMSLTLPQAAFMTVKEFIKEHAGESVIGEYQQDALWFKLVEQAADQVYSMVMVRKQPDSPDVHYLNLIKYGMLRGMVEVMALDMAKLQVSDIVQGM
jgi:hypothetical protein